MDKAMNCNLCARGCNTDREYKAGYCGMKNEIRIGRAALHMWEEPCISGSTGSGTVFFSGCSLRCVFCQNYKISMKNVGKTVSVSELADTFVRLQDEGACNINLVTPTHFVPHITQALDKAKCRGLNIPVVYNTGTYDTVDTIKMLEGYVDIYLPDFKYMSSELSKRYSNAPDYSIVAKKAIGEMYRQVGMPEFVSAGEALREDVENAQSTEEQMLMKKGMIVRHLVLPGCTEDSKEIIKYLYETYGDNIYISIMNQYTPLSTVGNIRELNRKVTQSEYDDVVDYALDIGVTNGFIQEGDTALESFIPEFGE